LRSLNYLILAHNLDKPYYILPPPENYLSAWKINLFETKERCGDRASRAPNEIERSSNEIAGDASSCKSLGVREGRGA